MWWGSYTPPCVGFPAENRPGRYAGKGWQCGSTPLTPPPPLSPILPQRSLPHAPSHVLARLASARCTGQNGYPTHVWEGRMGQPLWPPPPPHTHCTACHARVVLYWQGWPVQGAPVGLGTYPQTGWVNLQFCCGSLPSKTPLTVKTTAQSCLHSR